MEDGSTAVGLFNQAANRHTGRHASWADFGIHGRHTVRDLWRQKDVGKFDHEFHATVGPHGAEMFLLKAHRHQW